jgi:hypothetical protein
MGDISPLFLERERRESALGSNKRPKRDKKLLII